MATPFNKPAQFILQVCLFWSFHNLSNCNWKHVCYLLHIVLCLILRLLSGPLETRGYVSRGLILKIKLSVSIPRALLLCHLYSFTASPFLWRPQLTTANQCSWSWFHCIHCLFLGSVYPLNIPCGPSFLLSAFLPSLQTPACNFLPLFHSLLQTLLPFHCCCPLTLMYSHGSLQPLNIYTQPQQLSNRGWNSFNWYDLNDGRHGSVCWALAAPRLLAGCGGWMQKYPSPFRVNGR